MRQLRKFSFPRTEQYWSRGHFRVRYCNQDPPPWDTDDDNHISNGHLLYLLEGLVLGPSFRGPHFFGSNHGRRIRRILCSSARCRVVADKIIHELALLGQYVSTIQTRSNLARNGPEEEKGCIRWAAEAEEKRLLICIFSNCTLPSHDQASLLLSQLIVTKR
jgi:hypothetical protein